MKLLLLLSDIFSNGNVPGNILELEKNFSKNSFYLIFTFQSQLILAAIASPNTPLNDLIDEAGTYMSEGVTFGSRDSLKKSLTVARKSAENGGFRIKNYKNSETTKSSRAAAAAQNPPTVSTIIIMW